MLNELLVEQAVSSVYLAQDKKTDKPVFLITLQPDAVRSSDLADRFRRRAETLAQLEHDVIPPLLDYGMDGKRPYAIMAHLPGQFLAERLESSPKPDPQDKAKIVESLKLVKQLAEAVAITHPAGLIHHDLRPENIYLDESGQPHLLDLVVPPTSPATMQLDAEPITKLDYQSPEQLAGKALSGRSNIYSLGILLYRLLAGDQPTLPVSEWDIFEHKGLVREVPLNQVQPGLTAATYKAVQDSIWQKEWSRFETINAQIRAIDHALTEESAPPPPPPPIWLKIINRLRQPQTLKIVIPAIVLLFLLLLVLMFMRGRANRQGNATPTPDAAVLPTESETAVVTQPTTTTAATNEDLFGEGEVLPSNQEAETPTVRPSPTATAVAATPTESTEPSTIFPTSTATSSPSPTNTPTLEPTQISCIPSPPFGWARYTVQANDSLSALGEATDATVEQIMQVNCLDNILLSVGQQIWLPAMEPTATATPEPTATNGPATAVPPAPNPPGPNPPGPNPSSTPPEPPTPTRPSP